MRKLSPLLIYSLVGLCVYSVGLSGGFVFDDYPNILGNSFISRPDWGLSEFWLAVWSGDAGPTGRPVAMASFAIDSMLWGLDPSVMKFENVLIHSLTAYILFLLARRICLRVDLSERTAFWLPALTALVWLVHPLNLTGVLYIVQRMSSLSALFAALALLMYMRWRELLDYNSFNFRCFSGSIIFALASFLSKENGLLIIFYVLILEVILFNNYEKNAKTKVFEKFLLCSSVAAALLTTMNLFFSFVSFTGSYPSREFTVDQRLLTEFRVMASYLLQTVFPSVSEMSLYHDDIKLSESFFKPITTLFSFLFLIFLFILSMLLKSKYKIASISIFILFSSQLLETFTYGLEIKYEHRMYFSSFWVLFFVGSVFSSLIARSSSKILSRALLFFVVLLIGFAAFQTTLRSLDWSSSTQLAVIEAEQSPESYRANVQAGSVFASLATSDAVSEPETKAYYRTAQEYFKSAMQLKPRSASACLAGLILESRYNDRVPARDTVTRCNTALSGYIDASSVTSLQLLVRCQKNGDCTHDSYALELLDTAFDSSANNRRFQALILAEIGNFYRDIKYQKGVAINLYKLAEETYGKSQSIRYELIHMLVEESRYDEARVIAEKLKKTDRWRKYDDIYRALRVD